MTTTTSLPSNYPAPAAYPAQCNGSTRSTGPSFGNGVNEVTPLDSVTIPATNIAVDPPVDKKSPLARTFNGVKSAAWKAAWTGLWGLLALKGAVFLCGIGALPPLYFGLKSAGDAVRKFKEGYKA